MSNIARQAAVVLFARGLIRFVQFFGFLVLARSMSPSAFGSFGLLTSAIVIATLLGSLGLRQSIAYQIGRKQISPNEGVATVLAVWPIASTVTSIPIFVLYGSELGLSSHVAFIAIWIGVAGSMLVMLLQGVYLGRGNVNAYSAVDVASRIALFLFVVLASLALHKVSLGLATWIYALSWCAAGPIALAYAFEDRGHFRPRLDRLASLVSYGCIFALNLFLITLCSRLSMFVVDHFYGSNAAGQFFAASRLNEVFFEAAASLGLVLFSSTVREEQNAGASSRNAKISCGILWCFSGLAVVVALLPSSAVTMLLGAGYGSAGSTLSILALSLGPSCATKVIYPTIAGQGRPLFGTLAIAFAILVNLVIAVLLIPVVGLRGGAWAFVMGQWTLFACYVLSASRLFSIKASSYFVPTRADVTTVLAYVRSTCNLLLRKAFSAAG